MRVLWALVLCGCWVDNEVVVVSEPRPQNFIDLRLPPCGDSVALRELDRQAIAIGADTIIGPKVIHEEGSVRVTGLAVRGAR